jgi:uncharacterized protein (DUF697 family)
MQRVALDFVNILRELSLDSLRDEANTPVGILVVGPPREREEVARLLFGSPMAERVTLAESVEPAAIHQSELVLVVWTGANEAQARAALAAAATHACPAQVVQLGAQPLTAGLSTPTRDILLPLDGSVPIETARCQLAAAIDATRLPALGRHLPALRPAAALELVKTTSWANAQFAAFSNISTLVPLIGSLFSAGADMIVLTKNQMLLVYKLAAVHGRDLNDRRQIIAEMAPIVGAGFLWRTVARELATFLPAFLGFVPKVAVSYTGTYVIGQSAHQYFALGRKPTRDDITRWTAQARERLGGVLSALTRRRAGDKAAPAGALPPPAPDAAASDATVH